MRVTEVDFQTKKVENISLSAKWLTDFQLFLPIFGHAILII